MTTLNALDDLFRELKKDGVGKGDVAQKIGINATYLSKMLSGEKPVTDSFTSALHKYYGNKLRDLGINLKKTEVMLPPVEKTAAPSEQGPEPPIDYNSKAVYNLTESNRLIAESNASLAASNKELVQMVKESTASVPRQTDQDVIAMRSVFLELLSEVGSGKRWKSPEEVKVAYSKGLADVLGLMKEKDIQKNSGKKNSVK
jgi:plasmid maintenance system antidote protein VapI